MQQLSRKQQLLVGFTLFSMFFGAGNLIFPPQLGAQAGVQTWPAMAGLAISAIGLPILGVIAVVRRQFERLGQPGPSLVCLYLHDLDLSVHWPLSGHPPVPPALLLRWRYLPSSLPAPPPPGSSWDTP